MPIFVFNESFQSGTVILAGWQQFRIFDNELPLEKMTPNTSLAEQLHPQYFWDVARSELDDQLSSRLIIERIFNLGNLHEIKLVIDFYGKDQVVEVLMNLNYLDPKTFNFIRKLFKIPEKKFKCYTQKRLKNLHWNL